MRFGLVHRIMTDTLAVLGLLALLTSGELSRGVSVTILVGLVLALAVPDSFQERPLFQRFGVVAPLLLLAVQSARLFSGESLLSVAIEFAAGLQVLRLSSCPPAPASQLLATTCFNGGSAMKKLARLHGACSSAQDSSAGVGARLLSA